MQTRFPFPSPSTGLQAAGPFPSGPAAIILICVVIAGGAAFGIATQILLQHLGLGLDSIRNDVHAHRAATPHFALAWWAWWLCALGAFLVGPLCAAATRAVAAPCRLMLGLRSFVVAIAVLALACVAQLRSFPPASAVPVNSVVSLLVMIGSTVLALLGACLLGGIPRDRLHRAPGSIPGPATPSLREAAPTAACRSCGRAASISGSHEVVCRRAAGGDLHIVETVSSCVRTAARSSSTSNFPEPLGIDATGFETPRTVVVLV